MLLHRHQPSRPPKRISGWHPRLQLALLELSVSGGARHVRNRRALSSTV